MKNGMNARKTARRRARKPVPVVTSTVPDRERRPDEPHMVGYARVSMSDQNNQRQIDELVRFGVAAVDVFTDVASGKNMDRPGWEACWKDLREGDLLVIHSLDRLGRDLLEVVKTIRALHDKGANLKVLSMDIDTRTPVGQLIFHVMAAFAQFERELILERTRHGLAKARERGVVGGRQRKWTDEQIEEAVRLHGVLGAARALKASKVTIIRRMREIEEKQREQA